ncbi:MAG: glycosyltransferase family 2 protein [Rikenellaceae bacterium]
MTAIIILNWNGFHDTIACLDSLYKQQCNNFFIIVADNNSQDKSNEKLISWLLSKNINHLYVKENDPINGNIKHGDCIIYSLGENYGFAKGNNKALELLRDVDIDYYLFLNNDTVVTEYFLTTLVNYQQNNNKYKALTPQIRYFSEPTKIWNCGGRIFGGFRKYYYAKSFVSELPKKEFIPISFVTGCSLFITKDLLNSNKIFTEKFFFGEEDFEFSLRMQTNKIKMACVLDSIIYHKVSATQTNETRLGRVFIHYLNRFINIRNHYSSFYFYIWSNMNLIYINKIILRHLSKERRRLFVLLLKSEYQKRNSVSGETFNYYCNLFSK